MKETPSYDAEWEELISSYNRDHLIGATTDFARHIVLYDEGGFYLDFDVAVYKYTATIHYAFDYVGFIHDD